MDPKHAGDMLKHLEKQLELLMEAKRSMTDELTVLEVEHEMITRKFYEFMVAQGFCKEKGNASVAEDEEAGQAGALVNVTREEQP